MQDEEEKIEKDDVEFVEEDGEGMEISGAQKLKQLREKLKICEHERMEYLTGWQRAKADYVNLQKDEEGKRKNLRENIIIGILEDLLPTLDSFDMAFSNREAWEKVDINWRNGVEYTYQQFMNTLLNYGFKKIGDIGENFDPNFHESIENIPLEDDPSADEKDHKIASIIQFGYQINNKIIRPARVKVYIKN